MTSTRHILRPHSATPSSAISAIHVELARDSSSLALHYVAMGQVEQISLPPLSAPERADELWRHTCFEAFLRPPSGSAYREFNFSPSTRWAAYEFTAPRDGMCNADADAAVIATNTQSDRFELKVTIPLVGPDLFRLNLTAVIEETSGHKSYWALAHPRSGPPDFHHPDCFVLELPPAIAP